MEMALALASPEAARRRQTAGAEGASPAAAEIDEPQLAPADDATAAAPAAAPHSDEAGAAAEQVGEAPAPEGPRRLHAVNRSGRLELPRDAAANAAQTLSIGRSRPLARRRSTATLNAPALPPTPAAPAPAADAGPGDEQQDGNGVVAEAPEKKAPRRSRKTQTGLPEGWIIDEEGFVVPGPR
jgi:hypothetical protein